MTIFNVNLSGGLRAAFSSSKRFSHKKSYWARIIRKDGTVEYKYLKKEAKDHKQFEKAVRSGDVTHVMYWEEKDIEDTKEIMKMVFEQVEAALVMAHIQKNDLHELLKEDEKIGARGFPEDNIKKLERDIVQELAEINDKLRSLANMLLGESSKS